MPEMIMNTYSVVTPPSVFIKATIQKHQFASVKIDFEVEYISRGNVSSSCFNGFNFLSSTIWPVCVNYMLIVLCIMLVQEAERILKPIFF